MTRVLKNQINNRFLKFIFFCFLTVITLKSYSQTLKTFADENTTYTYYVDSITGEKIKQGSFKSIVKDGTSIQTITGNYKKGFTDGLYVIEEKAEKHKLYYPNEYSETGYSKASINIIGGLANGLWTYSKNWIITDLIVNYVKREPGKETITLSMQFSDGNPFGVFDYFYDANRVFEMLIKSNPLKLTNNGKFEATLKGKTLGQYNNDGFAVGKWTFDNGKLIVNFNNGVLIDVLEKFESTGGKYVDNNQDDDLQTLSKKYSNKEINIKELRQKLVKVDTVYMFEKSSFDFFNTSRDDFGRLIILSRFQKPIFNELFGIESDGTSNKSSVELKHLFEDWGTFFSVEDEKKCSQLVLIAKEKEDKEEIIHKEIEEQERKSKELELSKRKHDEELDKQNRITFVKYKSLQKEFQKIKGLPTIFDRNSNSMGYYDGNFKIFYDDLSNTVHKIIQSRISLEKELGKTLDTFYPTYKYETYSIMPYNLDSVYHEDSLRLQKINEIYLPQYETYQSILKKSNEIPQFFPQININIFDKNYIESKPNSQELYSALMEILNYNNEKLKLDSISITSKEEIISNINLVLNKTLSLLTENNKKIKSALKKGKTVEEKQNILISF